MQYKKNKASNVIISIALILILGLVAYGLFTNRDQETDQGARRGTTSHNKDVIDLVGTGYTASSTSFATQTLFQFASSTDETYWDTGLDNYPQYYGNTTTASFLVDNADFLTFNIYFIPENTSSTLDITWAGSNDPGCDNASSTLNGAEWFPLQLTATTTPSADVVSQTTIARSFAPAVSTTVKYSLTLEKLNYDCLRLQASNASTTDSSLLHIEVRKF